MAPNCSLCSAFSPAADMSTPQFARGQLLPITSHPCTNSTTNSTSDCCKFDLDSGQCGVVFHNTFQHPCSLCTEEEIPIPTKGRCNYCTESYPDEGMEDLIVTNGTITEQLSQHDCAILNGNNTAECCFHDVASNQCGIFVNDSFAYPCGSCNRPPNNRELDKTTLKALIGGSVGALVLLAAYFFWQCYHNVPRETVIKAETSGEQLDDVTVIPVGYETENITIAPIKAEVVS